MSDDDIAELKRTKVYIAEDIPALTLRVEALKAEVNRLKEYGPSGERECDRCGGSPANNPGPLCNYCSTYLDTVRERDTAVAKIEAVRKLCDDTENYECGGESGHCENPARFRAAIADRKEPGS